MINTQTMLSQYQLTKSPTEPSHAHHNNLNDKKQHVHHKHSQSLDATGPYIPISECHSGKSFMQKQQKSFQSNQILPSSNCSLGQDQHLSYRKISKINCEQKQVIHTRSNSNIVLGSKKQYGQQMNSFYFMNNPSTICSSNHQHQINCSPDVPTNRHFKIYERTEFNQELANSTSLIDVSYRNSNFCLKNCSLNCNCNVIKCSSCLQKPTNSNNRLWDTESLNDNLNNLSLNSYMNNSFIMKSGTEQKNPPPRPPKPLNLRSINNSHLSSVNNLISNNSFNESFSNNFSTISDEETSPTVFKQYNYYGQPNNQTNQYTRPKNSVSSSCSSNASPFCNYGNNQQDSVFTYDQNQLNLSSHSNLNFYSSSRLNCFEDNLENNDKSSPTYFNSQSYIKQLNNLKNNYKLSAPPAVNRNLKPKKIQSKQNSLFTKNSIDSKYPIQALSSYCQSNNGDFDEDQYDDNNYSENIYQRINHDVAIQYLDLDLDLTNEQTSFPQNTNKDETSKNNSNELSSLTTTNDLKETHTVYKTVDFVKTNALNKLRSNIENRHS